ncbi:MAG: TRAP transporter small permease subunit, partial [Chloroflexota bacterium]
MANVLKFLKYLDRLVLGLLKGIALGAFGLISLLILAGIFVRFVPVASLHWFDEILELLFAYMVFYGAAALWITGGHFSVGDWIKRRLFKHEAGRHFYQMLVDLIVLFFV